jgi:para-aminobenzoate synthetase
MLRAPAETPTESGLELRVRRLDGVHDAERAFAHLYRDSPNAFWLDSGGTGERARFSFIGDSEGPLGAIVTYDVGAGEVRVERDAGVEAFRESIFDYLDREVRRLRRPGGLPFDFDCGFAGYFGYELKADCDGDLAHESPLPDAAFIFVDRLIAFDRRERCAYVLCATEPGGVEEGERWIEETSLRLASLPSLGDPDRQEGPVEFRLDRSHGRYLEDIVACKRRLFEGETYEVCLTNRIGAEIAGVDPLDLYRVLRRVNPAPFASYLRFGDVAVLSSSPERFLSVGRDRWAEARPIKGTSRRGETRAEDERLAEELRTDEKSRAENVTIVDLLRNDLGAVCEYGTVSVPCLMEVETYETVHQLVSTVRGRLREDVGSVACIRSCFPPGSMTGAPKKRTMEIIDELEDGARGVYSGAIGYLGLGGGSDLSVAIRTIVLDGAVASIGVGGAIVMQSDPEGEYREALLKGRSQMRSIDSSAEPRTL